MGKTATFLGRARTAVGGDGLGETYYKFLAMHTGFMIFTGLPGIFINTFLMSQTDNMDVVLVYNMLTYMGTALGMLISADVVHLFHPGVAAVLGILGYDLLYLQLIVFNTQSASHVVLIGVTSGLAGAFYWISYSQLLTEYTGIGNRDSGMAIVSIMSNIVNLAIPLLSGGIISFSGRSIGYNIVFSMAFVIGIVTAVAAIRLPKPPVKEKKRVQHKTAIQLIFHQKALQFSLLSEGVKGIREGAFGFILSVFLYRLIQSEALIGFNTFLSAAVSIFSFLIISRKITGSNRIRAMKISLTFMLLFSVVYIFTMNAPMLIVFTLVNSFFAGFLVNSSFGIFLDALQVIPNARELRPELFAFKEISLATGRCCGVLVIMAIDRLSGGNLIWQAISLVILTLTQFITVWASKNASGFVEEMKVTRCEQ